MAELEKSNAALKKSLAKSSRSQSPERDAERTETHKILRGFFDFEEFVRRALAQHCAGIKPEQRDEFVGAFREVLVGMFSKDIHDHPNYDLQLTRETITGGEAAVEATLDLSNDSKKTTVAVEYKLRYKGDRWLAYDVIIDKQSMIKNYEAQFDKTITNESFDVVLKRTKKRLEKAE